MNIFFEWMLSTSWPEDIVFHFLTISLAKIGQIVEIFFKNPGSSLRIQVTSNTTSTAGIDRDRTIISWPATWTKNYQIWPGLRQKFGPYPLIGFVSVFMQVPNWEFATAPIRPFWEFGQTGWPGRFCKARDVCSDTQAESLMVAVVPNFLFECLF